MKARFVISLVAFFVFVHLAVGQDSVPSAITINNRTGDLPYSAQIGTSVEHVELSSGNLIITIPITNVPGRRLAFNYALRYDQAFWTNQTDSTNAHFWNPEMRNWLTSNTLGWTTNQPYLTSTYGKMLCSSQTAPQPGGQTFTSQGYRADSVIFTDESGSKHQMLVNEQNNGDCSAGSYSFRNKSGPSLGQDGYWANGYGTFLSPDGTQYTQGGTSGGANNSTLSTVFNNEAQITDVRGNIQLFTAGGTDTVGRTPVTQQATGNQIIYSVNDSSGGVEQYTVTLENVAISTSFNMTQPNVREYSATRQMVSSIELPSGESYGFTYDSFGEVTQIGLPTGGYVSYQWGNEGCNGNTHRAVTSRTVNGGQLSRTWSIAYASVSTADSTDSCVVTLTSPLDPSGVSHQTVYTYGWGKLSGPTGHPVLQSVVYDPQSNGTFLRRYAMSYQAGPSFSSGDSAPLLSSIQTTISGSAGTLTSKKAFDYDIFGFNRQDIDCSGNQGELNCEYFLNSGTLPSPEIYTLSHGNVTAIREYDWGTPGSGLPGSLIRQTLRTYLSDGTPGYGSTTTVGAGTVITATGANIVDKASEETVYDGSVVCTGTGTIDSSGTFHAPAQCGAVQLSDTKLVYDNGSPSTYGSFGLVTTAQKWLAGSYLTTHYVYDAHGNLTSITDPMSLSTTIQYSDSFASGASTCGITSGSSVYPTIVRDPAGHQRKLTYYGCTGKIQADRAPNDVAFGLSGTTYTYDSMGRTLQKAFSDGGSITTSYSDAYPSTVTSVTAIASGVNKTTIAQNDGLGRTVLTTIPSSSDSEGAVYTATQFDGLGRKWYQWNPTRCNPETGGGCSESSYGITTYLYDGLNRPVKVIPPDGSSTSNYVSTTYGTYSSGITGESTTVTDQAGVSHTSIADGVGRLRQVTEVNTGWNTLYSYDPLGNLTCVEQHGSASGTGCSASSSSDATSPWRVRRFVYDTLSRLTSSTNPETGQISYSYDNDGRLSNKVDARGTIVYGYDSASRLLSKTYSGSITPSACFSYDTYAGSSVPNAIGQMTGAWTQLGGCPAVGTAPTNAITLELMSAFDNVGRLKTDQQWPTGQTGPSYTLQHTYNLAGNETSYSNGVTTVPMTFTSTYDASDRLATVTAATPYADSTTYPATLFQANSQTASEFGMAYGPVGLRRAGIGITGSLPTKPALVLEKEYDSQTRANHETDVAYSGTSTAASGATGSIVIAGTELRVCSLTGGGTSAVTATTAAAVVTSAAVCTTYVYDSGYVSITINGWTRDVNYAQGTTAAGLASLIKVALNVTASGSPVTATISNSTTVLLTAKTTGQASDYPLSVLVVSNDPNEFPTPSFTATASGDTLTGGQDIVPGGSTVYSYATTIAGNGNISAVTDSVMGYWSYGYDGLNRLTSATSGSKSITWTYDAWGNRLSEVPTSVAGLTASSPGYSIQNKVSSFTYGDGAGAVTQDNLNQYKYDQEGRLCAVYNSVTSAIGYQYNAQGVRVAKGNLSSFACVASLPSATAKYLLGAGGEQVSELDGSSVWQHTNVWAGGKLLGTYDGSGLHFYLDDWLGSRRVQTGSTASVQQSCLSYPFGDGQTCTPSPSEHLFTGKERDTESGLDYFGARYYASSMGRFSSPDPGWLFAADLSNPQSLNMYSYVLNNPLINIDPTGMECVWDDGSYDAADDKQTGNAKGCSGQGGTYVDPNLFENAMMTNGQNANIQYGSWSGQANSTIASSWTTASATAYGGANAAQMEVNDAVGAFLGNGPKNIDYLPNDPFTLSFQQSAGMDAINAKITANCSATSGKVSVGSGEAFINTLIDGVAGGQGFHTPEAQLGAFNATYSRDGFTVSATVTNPISLNSAAYHATSAVGIKNPSSGPLGTVHQTVHIIAPDPCNGHS